MNLYFGNRLTLITTLLIAAILIYMAVLIKNQDKIKRWGLHTLVLLFFGLEICIQASTRDNFHLSVQNFIDGSTVPGLYNFLSIPALIGAVFAGGIIISSLCILFNKRGDRKKFFCKILISCITGKILILEICRIIMTLK